MDCLKIVVNLLHLGGQIARLLHFGINAATAKCANASAVGYIYWLEKNNNFGMIKDNKMFYKHYINS